MQSARLGSLAPSQKLTVATTARTTRFCRTHGPPCRRSIPGPCRQSRKLTSETEPDSAVVRTRLRAHRDYPPCPHLSCRRCRVHRNPAREHDDDKSPLLGEPGWATHTPKPNFGKVEYFCVRGLTEGDTARCRRYCRVGKGALLRDVPTNSCQSHADRGHGASAPLPTLR